jgi:hypothetical protein
MLVADSTDIPKVENGPEAVVKANIGQDLKTFAEQTIVNAKYFVISNILHTFATLFERLALVI